MKKSIWLFSAGLMALSTPAYAQQTDTDGTAAQPTDGATSEAAAVDNQATATQPQQDTGEIVVTATRRNQALSDVPLAVSAVTSENLKNTGASDIRQLNQVSPSLLVSSTSSEAGAGVARIRGVGTVGDNPGLESSVGVFIDGVYRSRAGVGLTELGPLDRIEVLRGPQGTLFGRNTSAGLISVITAKPKFDTEISGEATIGNYATRRFGLSATGGLSETIAARLDGVFYKRDGFLEDVVSGRDVNDRDRWLLRGQLLFEPSDNLSFRLIGDWSKRNEECCGATYLPAHDTNYPGPTYDPSTIKFIEEGLGGYINDDTFKRDISITPGRSFRSDVKDGGLSGELVYDLGGAELTSITAYRYNKYIRGQDADFNNLDILYRPDDGSVFNRFKTFSQELRLQGTTFGGKLDWLVGGYYANEKLRVDDNLKYGADYGRYANCLVADNFVASTGATTLLEPSQAANGTCFNQATALGVRSALIGGYNASVAAMNPAQAAYYAGLVNVLGAFARLDNSGFAPAPINYMAPQYGTSGFQNLLGGTAVPLANVGAEDSFNQTSNNFAIFTHNIFSITDQLKLTVGARYTHEKKTLDMDLVDVNNIICATYSGVTALNSLQQIPCVIPSVPGGRLTDTASKTENKLSGTAVISFKPTPSLLTYASYSHGYKAGGFNLDRSALTRTQALNSSGVLVAGAVTPAASAEDLIFKPEINDAFELGAKYHSRLVDVNVALFRQAFTDFQLNTFNGINFIVENINACKDDLGGADSDNSSVTGACTGKTRAGVINKGIEIEAFTRPVRNVTFNVGATLADTRYRDNLVGADGRALTNALFQLPGRRISNSSKWTVTSSLGWTPPIGSGGVHGLFYIDMRHQSSFNTGSDLDIEKIEDGYTVFNGRVGVRGPNDAWAVELWAQNMFKANYLQVGFDAPLQGSCTQRGAANGYCSPIPTRSTGLYGAFLAEPRTFGLTVRAKFAPKRPAPAPYVEPPAPPPPPPATQTCADGSVILATDSCPLPPPPPPPPPAPERG